MRSSILLLALALAVPLGVAEGDTTLSAGEAASPATGIGPGSRLDIEFPAGPRGGCAANFVWLGADGTTYLGTAGHCLLPDGRTATHGPGADYDASRVRVRVCVDDCLFGGQVGFHVTGTLRELGPVAYARQHGEGPDQANDFGLVKVPPDLLGLVRAQVPVWGGPTSATAAPAFGALCFYGPAMALGETFPTMARAGAGVDPVVRDDWQASLPVTFGDSGAALVSCSAGAHGLEGGAPVGIITHGVPGLGQGPSVDRARTLATQAGLSLTLVHT